LVIENHCVEAYFAHNLKEFAVEILFCFKDYPKGIKGL